MGVIYKLRDEVVDFIISQRQSNPLYSCRQLAESASQKFGLHLSKSSVHDVLKESGIVTPRGRKPKDKFEIPQERKRQIQTSLSQVKLLPSSVVASEAKVLMPDTRSSSQSSEQIAASPAAPRNDMEISPEYEGAGKIFYKAALWDLGVFSVESIKEQDWKYYLTYSKGAKVVLENSKEFFIDLPLPLERCIRETIDGIVNNTKPFIADRISDPELFKGCMEAKEGFKIHNISIVGQNDHVISEFRDIMDFKREFMLRNRVFVESKEKNILRRSKFIFFSQILNNIDVTDNIMNLKGFDTVNKDENTITLLINDDYDNKDLLNQAVERLNGMYLRDDQNRLVKVKIQSGQG